MKNKSDCRKIDLFSSTRHLCIFFTFPTFIFGPYSAQNGVRRSFHPAKPGDLSINVVPWSWAGVDRDHYRNHIKAVRLQSNKLNSKQISCLKKLNSGSFGDILTGAAHAAVERVSRAAGLGEVMIDISDCRGQSVASRAWA